ncbi:MAG: hypothetical protein AB8G05_06045 [Oligoflexales bacterium]
MTGWVKLDMTEHRVLPYSKPRSTYVGNYFTRFNKPKNPEYPGTFNAIKKPINVLTAINGLKFVPKSGIDNKGISATFKFINENIPKQNGPANLPKSTQLCSENWLKMPMNKIAT